MASAAERLTGDQMARRFGEALGKNVTFVDADPNEARSTMTSLGIPGVIVDTISRYCETVREGRWYTTSAVADILGRPPRAFDAWLCEQGENK